MSCRVVSFSSQTSSSIIATPPLSAPPHSASPRSLGSEPLARGRVPPHRTAPRRRLTNTPLSRHRRRLLENCTSICSIRPLGPRLSTHLRRLFLLINRYHCSFWFPVSPAAVE